MQTREITRNLVVIILIGAVLVGCSQSSTIPTIEPTSAPLVLSDGLDRSVSFEEPAQKIISIAPSNTEILFAIGAGSQVIGRDEFSDYPEEAKQVESIGGGFGAYDMEKIVALKPDLVLASQLTPAEQVEAFEKLGLKVYLLANPQDIEGMIENLKVIGQITGKETEAAALSEQLKARVATVDQKLANAENQPVVFYQIDSTDQNAPWTAGKGSFIDTLITRSGGNNLGAKKFLLAKIYGLETAKVATIYTILLGFIFIIIPQYVLLIITNDQTIIQTAVPSLRIAGFAQIFYGVGVVLANGLQAAGRSFFVMKSEVVTNLIIFVPLAYFLGVYLELGLTWAWTALPVYIIIYSLVIYLKFNSADWHTKIPLEK